HRRDDRARAARVDDGDVIATGELTERDVEQLLRALVVVVHQDGDLLAVAQRARRGRGVNVDAHEDLAAPRGHAGVARANDDRDAARRDGDRRARQRELAALGEDEADWRTPWC